MFRHFRNGARRRAVQGEYWLAGVFDGRAHPFADSAMATWSELLGREGAELWLAAKALEGRGR